MPGRPELLAPAGNWEALVAAVQNGADAVYLGGKSFSARQSAANFSDEELARVVEYAHVRGVKIYITVNTLIAEDEMEPAVRFLLFVQRSGADAAIIQDLGLAALARAVIPELPLHASTQMTIHNSPAIKHLQKMGLERFILARETSIDEIKKIKEHTRAEIEVFVHGALCVCYSGQCLFSSMVGGRSGNRGRCAQPCRLPYTLVDEQGRPVTEQRQAGEYVLSPRDLNISGHLPDLIGAGIDAFKIEGRLKRPEYVAVVTRTYRRLIDRAVSSDPGRFAVEPEEVKEMAQIFNREFTTGYFYARQGREMMSYKRPNNRGVFLGRVKSLVKGYLEITLEERLNIGDGLEVWVTEGGREGFEAREILLSRKKVESAQPGQTVKIAFRGTAYPKDRIFKTHDRVLIEGARITFTSPKETLKIPLAATIRGKAGKPLSIFFKDKENNTGEGKTRALGLPADSQALTAEYLYKQLSRLGNTPFFVEKFGCILDGEIIYPVGEINAARRQAIASLEKARAQTFRKKPVVGEIFEERLASTRISLSSNLQKPASIEEEPASAHKELAQKNHPRLAVAVNDPASLRAAVDAGADLIYFGGDYFRFAPAPDYAVLREVFSYCRERKAKFIYATPRIAKDSELETINKSLNEMSEWPIDGILAGNLGLLEKILENIKRKTQKEKNISIYADFSLNIFNSQACNYLQALGVKQITLSPELTGAQIRQVTAHAKTPVEVIVHGAVELMVSEYCALGSVIGGASGAESCKGPCGKGRKYYLKDRLGFLFPVEVDCSCRMHIFNSRELCLLAHIPVLISAGVSSLRIDARRQGPDYAYNVTRAYKRAIEKEKVDSKGLTALKENIKEFMQMEVTTGHIFRGVE